MGTLWAAAGEAKFNLILVSVVEISHLKLARSVQVANKGKS